MTPAKPTSLRTLLRAFASPDWAVVREGVDRAGDWLEAGAGREIEVAQLGARLEALARHPKWEVRRAVAHAVRHLRHHSFPAAIAPLLQDSHSAVRVAAERTLAKRTESTRSDVLTEQHHDLLLTWLAEVEAKHGRAARKAARRVVDRYAEVLVREARHEIIKVIAPLDASLINLESEVGRRRFDRAVFTTHLPRARKRLRLLTAIVDSLRAFTLSVTSKFRVEELRPIVTEAVSLVRDKLELTKEAVEITVEVEHGRRIEAHHFRLVQAFTNLIQNAVESYGDDRAPRRVLVAARVELARRVVLTVTDYGAGMNAEALRDAFQLFRSRKPQGTGFGLPLAKKIVETEHHGSLTLSSAPGKGTTVTVVLPIEQPDAELSP